ncbi:hypothetical protein PSY30_23435, partial [Shigella flexneri]|nr:hypothetical protein [Shigella flexneri]
MLVQHQIRVGQSPSGPVNSHRAWSTPISAGQRRTKLINGWSTLMKFGQQKKKTFWGCQITLDTITI